MPSPIPKHSLNSPLPPVGPPCPKYSYLSFFLNSFFGPGCLCGYISFFPYACKYERSVALQYRWARNSPCPQGEMKDIADLLHKLTPMLLRFHVVPSISVHDDENQPVFSSYFVQSIGSPSRH